MKQIQSTLYGEETLKGKQKISTLQPEITIVLDQESISHSNLVNIPDSQNAKLLE